MSSDRTSDFRLSDGAALKWARNGAVLLVIGLMGLLGWMASTPVDEVTNAHGEVHPIEQVRRIESLYGGRLASVTVALGQEVREGEVLAVFDRTEAISRLEAAEIKIAGLDLEIIRLTAFLENTDPNFAAFSDQYPKLVQLERAALEAQRAFVDAQTAVIRTQIAEKQSELAALVEELPELIEQSRLVGEERDVQQDLFDRGLTNRNKLASLREEAARLRLEQAKLTGRESVLEAEMNELTGSIDRVRLEEQAKAAARLVEMRTRRLEQEATAEGLKRRVAETEVRAPVDGVVQDLPDSSTGDVMQPGDLVASVVPTNGGLRFRGSIAPRDIAFVTEGQTVRLKFDSFDFSRYGALTGQVTEISPTTHVDPRGNAFYRVDIALDQAYFRNPDDGLNLLPGMTGEADIRTGQKTVFEYVWKPIYTNLDLALTER